MPFTLKGNYRRVLAAGVLVYLTLVGFFYIHIMRPARPAEDVRPLDTHIASCNNCTRPNFTTIVAANHICNTSRESNSIKLLIMIFSTASNFTARVLIRKTWGSRCVDRASGIRCVFLLAKSDAETNKLVAEESVALGDVLQFGFVENYTNLTYKTIMGLQWVTQHCTNARHILKTDDDMYVNTLRLPTELDQYPDRRFYGGYCWNHNEPIRENHKNSVTRAEYAADIYPPFCAGVGYVFSSDVARIVYQQSQNVPFLKNEDVFFGISCYHQNISAITLAGFFVPKRKLAACSYKLFVMTEHELTSGEIEMKWAKVGRCTLDTVTYWAKAWYRYELKNGGGTSANFARPVITLICGFMWVLYILIVAHY